jgi:hypothetical protein
MRIQDHDEIRHVTDPRQIEDVLRKRYPNGTNSFWLSHGSKEYPVINLSVNGDVAYLHYFPNEDHAGFASVGGLESLRPGGMSPFFLVSPTEQDKIRNEYVVSFHDALKVAREFAVSPRLPKSIEWDEL